MSLNDWLFEDFKVFGDRLALIDQISGRRYSYADVICASLNATTFLCRHDVAKGDVILSCLPNCPEFIFSFFGALPIGAILAATNPAYTAGEIGKQLDEVQPAFLLTDAANLDKCLLAANTAGHPFKKIFVIHPDKHHLNCTEYKADLTPQLNTHQQLSAVKDTVDKNDVAIMMFSSGTTGPPKAVMLTHGNLMAYCHVLDENNYFRGLREETLLGWMPFFHVYGSCFIVFTLKYGGAMIIMPKYHPEQFLQLIQQYKIRNLLLVPPMVLFLAKDPMVDRYDISSVESLFVGAAPLGEKLSKEVLDRHPNIQAFIQGYGLTECCGPSHVSVRTPKSAIVHGSCGKLLPGMECKVVEIKTGQQVSANQEGEIWVRGPTVMKGYWGRPKETSETVDADGWLHTGDIGHFDNDGNYFVVDRLKELIKVKGFQVAPAELEDVLLSCPNVLDAGVIGIPDEKFGEIPIAFVVPKNLEVTEHQITDFANSKVAHFKRIRKVHFIDALPKSPSGKILRRELRQLVAVKSHL